MRWQRLGEGEDRIKGYMGPKEVTRDKMRDNGGNTEKEEIRRGSGII